MRLKSTILGVRQTAGREVLSAHPPVGKTNRPVRHIVVTSIFKCRAAKEADLIILSINTTVRPGEAMRAEPSKNLLE